MTLYPWQYQDFQTLTNAFVNQHGHHALLFKTDHGVGTETLIRHFAQWLLCQDQQPHSPCHHCKSCQLWQSGNHPDFHLVQSIENKEISVEQIREVITRLQQFSQQGGNIVIYIDAIERLTESANNALLKTLEEPPHHCYFLLKSPLSNNILATIQSRCQTWLIQTPTLTESQQWLQPQFPTLPQQDIETALRLCHYRPLLCKTFLEQDRLSQRKAFLRTFWQYAKQGDVWLLFSTFEKEMSAILMQLEWIDSFFQDALKAKLGISNGWINADLHQGITLFSQQLSPHQLLKGHQIIQKTQQDLNEINAVNAELMIMDCLTTLITCVFSPT